MKLDLGHPCLDLLFNDFQVTQYSCNFENLAPDGCTQYLFGASSNTIQSYNYDGSHHLANQNQAICIRQSLGKNEHGH